MVEGGSQGVREYRDRWGVCEANGVPGRRKEREW